MEQPDIRIPFVHRTLATKYVQKIRTVKSMLRFARARPIKAEARLFTPLRTQNTSDWLAKNIREEGVYEFQLSFMVHGDVHICCDIATELGDDAIFFSETVWDSSGYKDVFLRNVSEKMGNGICVTNPNGFRRFLREFGKVAIDGVLLLNTIKVNSFDGADILFARHIVYSNLANVALPDDGSHPSSYFYETWKKSNPGLCHLFKTVDIYRCKDQITSLREQLQRMKIVHVTDYSPRKSAPQKEGTDKNELTSKPSLSSSGAFGEGEDSPPKKKNKKQMQQQEVDSEGEDSHPKKKNKKQTQQQEESSACNYSFDMCTDNTLTGMLQFLESQCYINRDILP